MAGVVELGDIGSEGSDHRAGARRATRRGGRATPRRVFGADRSVDQVAAVVLGGPSDKRGEGAEEAYADETSTTTLARRGSSMRT